jgi:hypothetical protein
MCGDRARSVDSRGAPAYRAGVSEETVLRRAQLPGPVLPAVSALSESLSTIRSVFIPFWIAEREDSSRPTRASGIYSLNEKVLLPCPTSQVRP